MLAIDTIGASFLLTDMPGEVTLSRDVQNCRGRSGVEHRLMEGADATVYIRHL